MKGSTLQQLSDTWPYGQMQQIQEREGRALQRREVRIHVGTGAKGGENHDRGAHGVRANPPENSQSSATNKRRTRKGRQNPPEQSRASQSARSAQTRVMPSKTTSRPRARAGESAASPRKRAHGTVDKEAQHWRGDTRSCSWAPRQLRARRTPRSTSDFSPHGAFGGLAEATAALVASTPTSTSGVGRLGDGGCSSHSCRCVPARRDQM